jgi:hypothetical protein
MDYYTKPTTTTPTTKRHPTAEEREKAYQEAKADAMKKAFSEYLDAQLDEALEHAEIALKLMAAIKIPKKLDATTNSQECRKDCKGVAYVLEDVVMRIRDNCGDLG